jgi:hypothetical protein
MDPSHVKTILTCPYCKYLLLKINISPIKPQYAYSQKREFSGRLYTWKH